MSFKCSNVKYRTGLINMANRTPRLHDIRPEFNTETCRLSVMDRLWCLLDWCFGYSILSSRTPAPPSLWKYLIKLELFLTINTIQDTPRLKIVSLEWANCLWKWQQIPFENKQKRQSVHAVDCQDSHMIWSFNKFRAVESKSLISVDLAIRIP